jgi:Cu/Ag efflux protein CusF
MVPIQHHSPSGVPISGVFEGYGTIKSVDTEKLSLVMDHGPIPAIGWGPMVMGFKVKDKSLLEGLAAGDKVRFDLQVDSGDYYIVDMEAQ